jgi:hypothetical protein
MKCSARVTWYVHKVGLYVLELVRGARPVGIVGVVDFSACHHGRKRRLITRPFLACRASAGWREESDGMVNDVDVLSCGLIIGDDGQLSDLSRARMASLI